MNRLYARRPEDFARGAFWPQDAPIGAGDKMPIVLATLLSLIGVMMIHSVSGVMARDHYGNMAYFTKRQIVALLCGLLCFAVVSRLHLQRLRALILPIAVSVFLLLLAVLVFGREINGARRWFEVGALHVQPSEIAKLFVVFYLAHCAAKKKERLSHFWHGLAPPLMLTCALAGLVVLERDLGGAVVILMLMVLLLLFAGANLRHLACLVLVLSLLLALMVVVAPYRMARLMSFLDPWADPLDGGHQIIQAMMALGVGGLGGVGLGGSTQKLFYLPEMHTDFIFPAIGEEFGLIGTLTIEALFIGFLFAGLRIARAQGDVFLRLLALGATLLIVLSALIHMGVTTALLPTKGLPLPFVSYGGSSLVACWAATGLLFNVSRRGGP